MEYARLAGARSALIPALRRRAGGCFRSSPFFLAIGVDGSQIIWHIPLQQHRWRPSRDHAPFLLNAHEGRHNRRRQHRRGQTGQYHRYAGARRAKTLVCPTSSPERRAGGGGSRRFDGAALDATHVIHSSTLWWRSRRRRPTPLAPRLARRWTRSGTGPLGDAAR